MADMPKCPRTFRHVGHFGHVGHFWHVAIAIAIAVAAALGAQPTTEKLRSVGGLPAHLCGQLREPVAFTQASTGQYLILDRREHTVWTVDKAGTKLSTLMRAGLAAGNVLQPAALSLAPGDFFAVSDAPYGRERIQMYTVGGALLGAFLLPGVTAPRLTLGGVILNGSGSLHFTGKTVLLNRPESGSLVWVLDLGGNVVAQVGDLRRTGHEADRDVHIALNIGLPLATNDGGFMFVFQTGVPMFRKYSAEGRVEFERHIEGPPLDAYIQQLPTTWPVRKAGDGTYPLVPPVVRTAAISPEGDLWISLLPLVTYVYGPDGEKKRTVQLDGAGTLAPASLSFSRANGRLLVMPGCYEFEPGA